MTVLLYDPFGDFIVDGTPLFVVPVEDIRLRHNENDRDNAENSAKYNRLESCDSLLPIFQW